MELFIIFGAGLVGAAFYASRYTRPVPLLWKAVSGGGAGLLAWFVFDRIGSLPATPSINGFIMLFVLGGVAGGLALQFFLFAHRKIHRLAR